MNLLIPLFAFAASASTSLSEIEREVQAHVADRAQKMGHEVHESDVEIASLGLLNAPDCAETAKLTVTSSPAERFLGRADLMLTWSEGDTTCASLRVETRLTVHTFAPVAAAPAAPGERVSIAQTRVPLHKMAGTPIDPKASNNWLARTALATGTALTTARVKAAPDAESGAEIELVAQRGAISIRAPGRLLASARVGDTVRVANLATNTVVEGTLVSPQSVHIER